MIFVILLVCVLAFGIVINEKMSRRSADYDERQIALQDRAYRHAFLTIILFCAGHYFWVLARGAWLPEGSSSLICIFLGVLVFAGESIWNDAYFPFRKKGRGIIILWAAMAAVQLAVFIDRGLYQSDGARGGMLTLDQITPLVMAVVFGGLLGLSLVKWVVSRREDRD